MRGTGTALFLLPTDTMGGAENVLRLTADAALRSGRYARVRVFVLSGSETGTLDRLREAGAEVVHTGANSESRGLPALLRMLRRERYALVFSSHTHLNAAASAARAANWLRTERLVARESTMMLERDLGRVRPLVTSLYRLYGAQDRIVCQTERMASSLTRHTRGRFAARTAFVPNPLGGAVRAHNASSSFRIAWCGRLACVKSPERALEALAKLRADGHEASLVMIGDGPLRTALEERSEERQVRRRSRRECPRGHRRSPWKRRGARRSRASPV